MPLEGQTRDFRNLATESKEATSQMDDRLKKIIAEVQELSDDKTDNDEMNGVLGDNFDASLNATEEQIKTITRELGKLEKKYKDNATVLKQIQDLTALLEGKIDGDKQRESFNNFSGMIPEKINRLKEDLSRQDKRNIENFIKGDGNKNAVLETYLKMIGVGNMPDHTTSRDQRIFDEIKTQIEGKYNEGDRAQRELDTKVFADVQQFFEDYIQNNSDWEGNTEPTADYIQEKCSGIHMYTADQFKAKFIEKNGERIKNNNEEFGKITMEGRYNKEKIKKVKGDDDTFTLEITKDDETTDTATVDDFMQKLGIQIEAPEGTAFTSGELQAAIDGKKQSWFDAIVAHVEEKPEPEQPQVESLEASQITVNLFNNISADDVKGAVDAAIANLSAEGLDQEAKEKFTARIKEVTDALKDGGEALSKSRKPGHENIKKLQETIQKEINLTPRLRPDGKLGRLTLYAMQKYMGVETGKSGDLKYECGHMLGSELSGMLEHIEDEDPTELKQRLHSSSDDLGELRDKAEAYIKNPLLYVKDKLDDKLGTCEVPGKAILRDILNESPVVENKIKLLQFALLPDYTGNIDGKIGPATKKALQSYVDKSRTETGDNIKSLGTGSNPPSVEITGVNIESISWNDIDNSTTDYDNAYALISNKTIKFFDSITIGNLKTETKKIGDDDTECTTGFIKGKKYVFDGTNLYNQNLTEYTGDDSEKLKIHFETAKSAISSSS